MSDPNSYPQDQGPFDAAAETAPGEKTFTADEPATDDDPAAPDAVQYDADHQTTEQQVSTELGDHGLDPLEQGDEADVDPDLGISQG